MVEGVWRTVGGRRIFIKEGQSLSDAMKSSKKFDDNKIKEKVKKQFDRKKQTEEETKKQYKEYVYKNGYDYEKENPATSYKNSIRTEEQKMAVERYTSFKESINHYKINRHLNEMEKFNEGTTANINKISQDLDSSIVGETSVDMYTYRGIALKPNEINIGDQISNKGFTSTSIDKNIANDFAQNYEGTVLQLKVKKGTKALYIGSNAQQTFNEAELLFGRNTKITIIGKNDNGVIGEITYE